MEDTTWARLGVIPNPSATKAVDKSASAKLILILKGYVKTGSVVMRSKSNAKLASIFCRNESKVCRCGGAFRILQVECLQTKNVSVDQRTLKALQLVNI